MESINPFWLVALSAVLAVLPVLMTIGTCYLKLSIILGMLKHALSAQQIPGAACTLGLALALTMFIMGPVFSASLAQSTELELVLKNKTINFQDLQKCRGMLEPWKSFLRQHAGVRETELFRQLSLQQGLPGNQAGDSFRILAPAFMLTELKEAFTMGFILLLPFLVIDLVVANILVGLGMYMLSPTLISLPLKVLLLVVSDGWLLILKTLVLSYNIGG